MQGYQCSPSGRRTICITMRGRWREGMVPKPSRGGEICQNVGISRAFSTPHRIAARGSTKMAKTIGAFERLSNRHQPLCEMKHQFKTSPCTQGNDDRSDSVPDKGHSLPAPQHLQHALEAPKGGAALCRAADGDRRRDDLQRLVGGTTEASQQPGRRNARADLKHLREVQESQMWKSNPEMLSESFLKERLHR